MMKAHESAKCIEMSGWKTSMGSPVNRALTSPPAEKQYPVESTFETCTSGEAGADVLGVGSA